MSSLSSFNPFVCRKKHANCVVGQLLVDGKRAHEVLYCGSGVFVSPGNILNARELLFDGVKYSFSIYAPEHDSLVGVMCVYYVGELKDVGSSCAWPKYTPNAKLLELSSYEGVKCKQTFFSGRNFIDCDREKSKQEALDYSIRKYMLPKNVKLSKSKFMNEAVAYTYKGKEYPGIMVYHKSRDVTPFSGSLRIISKSTFISTQWRLIKSRPYVSDANEYALTR